MAALRRTLLGLALLTSALWFSRYSASLPRSAWFAKANAMSGAALCGGAVVTILCRSLRISEHRFNSAWWSAASILLPVGVALMWLAPVISPRMATQPLSWLLIFGVTVGWLLFLRMKKLAV